MSPVTVRVAQDASGEEILAQLAIDLERPLVVLMGGAAGLSPEDSARLERQIGLGLAQAIAASGANVVDGGTDSGVMGMLNASLAELDFSGAYIGIAPAGLVYEPEQPPPDAEYPAPLGMHHTHFVLPEGDNWGDEIHAMYALINLMARGVRSIGVLANGGNGAQKEVAQNASVHREVVILSGSGRLADRLTQAVQVQALADSEELAELARLGRFTLFDISQPPEDLAQILSVKLS